MSIEFRERENEGVTLIDLKGQLALGDEDLRLQAFLRSFIVRGQTDLILNLEHVHAIDTAAVGTLRIAANEFRKRNGKLVLLNLPVHLLDPSVMLSLEVDFQIFDNESDAVNSFFPSRTSRPLDLAKALSLGRPSQSSVTRNDTVDEDA
jgi:anti-sigma B factor antagonist